jgi:hypothetical protein
MRIAALIEPLKPEATVLRRAEYGRDQVAGRRGAASDRRRATKSYGEIVVMRASFALFCLCVPSLTAYANAAVMTGTEL